MVVIMAMAMVEITGITNLVIIMDIQILGIIMVEGAIIMIGVGVIIAEGIMIVLILTTEMAIGVGAEVIQEAIGRKLMA